MGFKQLNKGCNQRKNDEDGLFTEADLIYAYTDADAIADGVLVDIKSFRLSLNGLSVNRITRNLYDELMKYALHRDNALNGMLKAKIEHASVPEGSHNDGYFYSLPSNIWAIRNEIDGYTLMFPEDY